MIRETSAILLVVITSLSSLLSTATLAGSFGSSNIGAIGVVPKGTSPSTLTGDTAISGQTHSAVGLNPTPAATVQYENCIQQLSCSKVRQNLNAGNLGAQVSIQGSEAINCADSAHYPPGAPARSQLASQNRYMGVTRNLAQGCGVDLQGMISRYNACITATIAPIQAEFDAFATTCSRPLSADGQGRCNLEGADYTNNYHRGEPIDRVFGVTCTDKVASTRFPGFNSAYCNTLCACALDCGVSHGNVGNIPHIEQCDRYQRLAAQLTAARNQGGTASQRAACAQRSSCLPHVCN